MTFSQVTSKWSYDGRFVDFAKARAAVNLSHALSAGQARDPMCLFQNSNMLSSASLGLDFCLFLTPSSQSFTPPPLRPWTPQIRSELLRGLCGPSAGGVYSASLLVLGPL